MLLIFPQIRAIHVAVRGGDGVINMGEYIGMLTGVAIVVAIGMAMGVLAGASSGEFMGG